MRIEVIGEDESIHAQARTYAEYRVFAALVRHSQAVRGARVVLRRDERGGTCDTVVCAVTIVPLNALSISCAVEPRSALHPEIAPMRAAPGFQTDVEPFSLKC